MSFEQPSLPAPPPRACRDQNNPPIRSAWGLGSVTLLCFKPPVLYQGPGGWRRRCGRTPCHCLRDSRPQERVGRGWGGATSLPGGSSAFSRPLTSRTPLGRAGNMEADAALTGECGGKREPSWKSGLGTARRRARRHS